MAAGAEAPGKAAELELPDKAVGVEALGKPQPAGPSRVVVVTERAARARAPGARSAVNPAAALRELTRRAARIPAVKVENRARAARIPAAKVESQAQAARRRTAAPVKVASQVRPLAAVTLATQAQARQAQARQAQARQVPRATPHGLVRSRVNASPVKLALARARIAFV